VEQLLDLGDAGDGKSDSQTMTGYMRSIVAKVTGVKTGCTAEMLPEDHLNQQQQRQQLQGEGKVLRLPPVASSRSSESGTGSQEGKQQQQQQQMVAKVSRHSLARKR
jgi:hypothetical protein